MNGNTTKPLKRLEDLGERFRKENDMPELDMKIELPFEWCEHCDAMSVEHWTDKYEYRDEYEVLRVEYRSGFGCKNSTICVEANRARIKDVLQNKPMIE